MEFGLLGPVAISDGARRVRLAGVKPAALLVRLLLDANRVVPAGRLVEDLWNGQPPASAAPTLQGYITGLRRALQPGTPPSAHMLRTHRPGYVLELAPDRVDAHRFEALLRRGQQALKAEDWDVAAGTLAEALALWRGPALVDVTDHLFAQAEATRLQGMRLQALEDRISAELALGRHAQLIAELEALVAAEPLRESLCGLLIVALYRCGRQADALDRYRILRGTLAEALGIDPGPDLQRLHDAVLLQKPELDWSPPSAAFSPVRHPPARVRQAPAADQLHNLPLELTSFVGRGTEVAEVTADLAALRLVTLGGPGGVGKSRLALRAARDAVGRVPGGVWLLELAALDRSVLLADRLLAILDKGGRNDGDPVTALIDQIGPAEMLVVLDNCEHLVTACADLATTLLRHCPGVRVLATSRQSLGVPGERIRQVAPFAVPGHPATTGPHPLLRSDAARLFIDRASAMDPDFAVGPDDAEAVAQICRRLDGIPLALELAAARTRVLSVHDIAVRLDDVFGVLGTSGETTRPRHRTLRAVMDWSSQLLSDDERALLGQLAVFAGSFSLAAAEHVGGHQRGAGRVLEALAGLVDKSLLAAADRAGGRRYWLLETVRQYAHDQLEASGDAASARDRHARHYVGLAEHTAPKLYGTGLADALDDLAADHENFRAALDWLAATADEQQVPLVAALWRYCYLRGHYRDGRAWLARALDRASNAVPLAVARATHGAAALAFYQCDYPQAEGLCDHALQRHRDLGDRSGEGAVLTLRGSIAREQGAYARAIALHEQSLTIAEELADIWAIAHELQMCAFATWLSGDYDRAHRWATQSFARCRLLDDEERMAWALIDLGAIAHYTSDGAAAGANLQKSLELSRRLSFKEGIAWSLNLLGLTAHGHGDDATAVVHLAESMRLHAEVGDRWRAASVLEALAASAARSAPQFAGRMLGHAGAIRTAIGAPIPPCERPLVDGTIGVLRECLGQARLDALWAVGAQLSLHAAIREATTLPTPESVASTVAGSRASAHWNG